MDKFLGELQLVGIDVDSEKLQHSKFESRSTAHSNLMRSHNGRVSVFNTNRAKANRNSTIKSQGSKMNVHSYGRDNMSCPDMNF